MEKHNDFTKKVYAVVARIERGKVMTYAAVARAAGSPKAYRAVGNILNKNHDTRRVPCHRVIKSNGFIGGYVRGTKKKMEILKKEGLGILNGKVVQKNYRRA